MRKKIEFLIYISGIFFFIFLFLSFINNFLVVDFFKMNFFNYLTIFIGIVVSYYLNNKNNDKRRVKDLIEKTVYNTQITLRNEIIENIKNQKLLQIHLRKISNNIYNITKLLNEINIFDYDKILDTKNKNLRKAVEEYCEDFDPIHKCIETLDDYLNLLIVNLYCSK